jgi:hypothetical protein
VATTQPRRPLRPEQPSLPETPSFQPPHKKKSSWKVWVAIIFAGLVIIGALVGDDSTNQKSNTPAEDNQAAAGADTPQPTAEPTPEPVVDLKVSSPSAEETIRSPEVTVRGTAKPATARVKIDGKSVKVRDGRFSRTVKLDVGQNIIAFEATASGFGTFEDSRNVTRKRSAAELAVIRADRAAARQARIAALTQEFSGNGSQNIGSFAVDEESVLEWTNYEPEYPEFRQMLMYDKGFNLSVSSDAASGKTVLDPGRYRSVTVAGGDWTITIKPR